MESYQLKFQDAIEKSEGEITKNLPKSDQVVSHVASR